MSREDGSFGAAINMLINFKRTGGFANVVLTYNANTADLSAEVAEELSNLIENSDFFGLEETESAGSGGVVRDVFLYQLSVREGEKKKSLVLNDATVPEKLRPLLSLLQELALNDLQKKK